MPLLIDRRGFLKVAGAGIATIAANRSLRADAPLKIALLADTHIAADAQDQFRGFFPSQNLKTVTAQVAAFQPGLLVVNGDLARLKGEPGDYTRFTAMLDPLADKSPIAVTLGNHDDRKNARSALTKRAGDTEPVEQKLVSVLEVDPFRFVFLDSLLATNVTPGQLGNSQREWLSSYLDAPGMKPIIVFVHHDPDPDDDGGLVDAQRLLDQLRPHRAVKALLFGHTHVYSYAKQDGLHLINLPAVGYNFADNQPVGWLASSFTGQGADFTLHAIGGNAKDNRKSVSVAWR